jgi:hypothetical protein
VLIVSMSTSPHTCKQTLPIHFRDHYRTSLRPILLSRHDMSRGTGHIRVLEGPFVPGDFKAKMMGHASSVPLNKDWSWRARCGHKWDSGRRFPCTCCDDFLQDIIKDVTRLYGSVAVVSCGATMSELWGISLTRMRTTAVVSVSHDSFVGM